MRAKPRTQSPATAGALAAALLLAALPAAAQTFPAADIRLICGYPAGSGADIIVRYYAEKLRPLAGRTVLVDNKTGAMGNIATEYVARAKPDGTTVYLNGSGVLAASMYLFKKPPVDVGRELQVVAAVNRLAAMLAVRADAPWQSLAQLTAYLKQKGDKASYAAANPVSQAVGEIYKQATGVTAVQVNYKTGFDTATTSRAARSITRSSIRSTRWRSSARDACASWPSPAANAWRAFPTCRPSPSRACP